MQDKITQHLERHITVINRTFHTNNFELLKNAAAAIQRCLKNDNKLLFFGNGGSAADAQHIAAEFVSKLSTDRIALPGLALTVDTSALTAISNDFGYENVFSRQVEAFGKTGDIAVGITTSGNSANVIRGLQKSKDKGLKTISLCGDTGIPSFQADFELRVASNVTATIQELHIMFGHILCELAEEDYV
jgi:D-sedoheptulose 7-phosphate isomerase